MLNAFASILTSNICQYSLKFWVGFFSMVEFSSISIKTSTFCPKQQLGLCWGACWILVVHTTVQSHSASRDEGSLLCACADVRCHIGTGAGAERSAGLTPARRSGSKPSRGAPAGSVLED